MKMQFSFHQVDVSQALQKYSQDAFEKVGQVLLKASKWQVVYSMKKHECQVSVTVNCAWGHFRASANCDDFYASADQVAGKLEKQFLKRKEVLQHHKNPEKSKQGKLARLTPSFENAPAPYYRKAS